MERLYERYTRAEYHSSDPVEYVHRFSDPLDQEAAGLFGALMAYGGVVQIRRAVESILSLIQASGRSPAGWVKEVTSDPQFRADQSKALTGFRHRLYVGADILTLGRLLGTSWERHGSLGGHFSSLYVSSGAATLTPALDGVMAEWKAWSKDLQDPRPGRFFFHLLSAPRDGSACKRWCMYLRWMVRRDAVDPGPWGPGGVLENPIPPSALLVPLDTHSGRISRYIGLTRRRTLNWKAVEEVTEGLRALDASDPVRYDFALARLGILRFCRKRYVADICPECDLHDLCRFTAKHRRDRVPER
jgi:uncharacterized protein (TIGR02757 family)